VDAVRRVIWLLLDALSGRASAQPTAPASPEAAATAGSPAAEADPPTDRQISHRREHKPGFELDCEAPPTVRHVGIVFVHGIGSQEAGSTLLEWSSKIIALLLDARSTQEAKGDPVIDVQLDKSASSRFIELRLPEATTRVRGNTVTIPEQHWVMTEAWWAERVRPPAFGEMAEWLGPRGAITRIVTAMLPRNSNSHDPRLRPAVQVHHLEVGREKPRLWDKIQRRWHQFRNPRRPEEKRVDLSKFDGTDVVKEPGDVGYVYTNAPTEKPRRRFPVRVLLLVWNAFKDFVIWVLSLTTKAYFQAISSLVLVVYGALRSVEKILPIGPLKDGALTRPIDRFILEWFGDVYVLLQEPAQAASVRDRLIDAVRDLEWNGCKPVNVVAHSGGAIVSYMTLADEAQKDRIKVDRLITLGEGLNLAWRLLASNDGAVSPDTKLRYDRLYTDVFKVRKHFEWHDFWASQDPAPVGVVSPEVSLVKESPGQIHSHAIWNRLAFREDHGTYWDNDEEFLIPVARLMDANPAQQRVFRDSDEDRKRSLRRRRRLTFLSIWRQLALVAPTAAIITAYAYAADPNAPNFIVTAADKIAELWAMVPGSDLIIKPVEAIRKAVPPPDYTEPWRTLGEAGVWVIAAIIALLTLVSLIAPPERPVPWNDPNKRWYRPFNLFARFLRWVPFIVAALVFAAVVLAAMKFIEHSTSNGLKVGFEVFEVLAIIVGAASIAYVVFHLPWKDAWGVRWMRDGVRLVITIVVMALVAILAITPFIAVLIFDEVGTRVLGIAAVIIAFQLIARIGTWRWAVWDGRERVAVRTHKPPEEKSKAEEPDTPTKDRAPRIVRWIQRKLGYGGPNPYPPLLRIFVQMTLLMTTVFIAFGAVVTNSTDLTLLAGAVAAFTVLLGIAVDVMDSERGRRRDPSAMSGVLTQ
jgi:hypothetical protein